MRKRDLIIIIPFLAFIFTFGILYFFIPDVEFSENENKYLEQLPKVSFKNIMNGKFESDFETYMSDQIAGRDFWVSCNTALLLASGKNDVNGVYVGSDGYLLEAFDGLDFDRYEKQIEALNKFNSYVDAPIYFVIAPNSVSVHEDKLPGFAVNYSQDKYISDFYEGLDSDIITIDVSSALKEHSDEYIYYRTDHHWTTYGSFLAFNEISEAMGISSWTVDEVVVSDVSSDFLGTFFSKGNFIIEPDTIQRYDIKNGLPYKVFLSGGVESNTLYDDSYLGKKDKYAYFAHGNPDILTVETESESDKTLVVIKDSYMHCMLQFFIPSYKTIHMVDPRYIKTNLTEYIMDLDPDEILVLYNAKTLSDDVNFTRLGTAPKK